MRSIRAKLVFWVCVLFIFIGALIYLPLFSILPQKITSQILKRDVEIAKYISNEAKNFLLLNDRIALSLLLHENLDKLEDAQYLFIQGPDGDIIVHTFTDGFPRGLLSFGLDTQHPYLIKRFLSGHRKIYDIAIPILEGEIGVLHLGVSLESGKKDIAEVTKINYYVTTIIFIGLGIGVFIFLTIGFLFSSQIIKLKDFVAKIGRGNLNAKIDITSKDEIGTLSSAFNKMARDLKEKIQEINRLNTIEERNRIALDLHDGSAQDLASIIKRIELCEKLFKIEPQRTFEELGALREDTKDVLKRTRQVIFDLKLPHDSDFNLLDRLTDYIKEYQNQNDINIKLNISGHLNNIPPDKSKSIFYIIAEALTNIKKHSRAKNIDLSLESSHNSRLSINIKDDGQGFDVNQTLLNVSSRGNWGLISMRQRTSSLGGKFIISSRPQEGTKVYITIPLTEGYLE